MKYLWTTIKVKNMEESLHFYKDLLGLKVKDEKHVSEGFDLAFLDMGESDIELLCNEKMDCTIGSGVSIGFEVESIEEVRTKLEKEGYEVGKEQSPEDGMKFVMVKDPNGLGVQLVEYR